MNSSNSVICQVTAGFFSNFCRSYLDFRAIHVMKYFRITCFLLSIQFVKMLFRSVIVDRIICKIRSTNIYYTIFIISTARITYQQISTKLGYFDFLVKFSELIMETFAENREILFYLCEIREITVLILRNSSQYFHSFGVGVYLLL